MGIVQLEGGCCRKSMGFCNGAILEGDGLLALELSSSLEVLKVNQQHTGLWCDWLVPVLHGVTGSKEMFSALDTWWILEVLLSELAFPHIRCCLSSIPSDLMRSYSCR